MGDRKIQLDERPLETDINSIVASKKEQFAPLQESIIAGEIEDSNYAIENGQRVLLDAYIQTN